MYSAALLLLLSFTGLLAQDAGRNEPKLFSIDIQLASSIASIVPEGPAGSPNRLHYFVRNCDNSFAVRTVDFDPDGNGPTKWESLRQLGGGLVSTPAGVCFRGQCQVFGYGYNNNLYVRHRMPGNPNYNDWGNLGGVCYGSPGAADIAETVHVFVRGTDNGVWVRWMPTNNAWYGYAAFGGVIVSNPTATGFTGLTGTKLGLVAAIGTDNKLWFRQWNGGAWNDWSCLDGSGADHPVAIGINPRNINGDLQYTGCEIYMRNCEGVISRRVFDGDIWQNWDPMPFFWGVRPFQVVLLKNSTAFFGVRYGKLHGHFCALPRDG